MKNFYKNVAFGSLMFLLSAGAHASLSKDQVNPSVEQTDMSDIVAPDRTMLAEVEKKITALAILFKDGNTGFGPAWDRNERCYRFALQSNIQAFVDELMTAYNSKDKNIIGKIASILGMPYNATKLFSSGNESEVVSCLLKEVLLGNYWYATTIEQVTMQTAKAEFDQQLQEYGINEQAKRIWTAARTSFHTAVTLHESLSLREVSKHRHNLRCFFENVNTNKDPLNSLLAANTQERYIQSCNAYQVEKQALLGCYEEWISFLSFCLVQNMNADRQLLKLKNEATQQAREQFIQAIYPLPQLSGDTQINETQFSDFAAAVDAIENTTAQPQD